MANPDWARLLDEWDFSSAHAAWQQEFGASGDSLEGSWILAEIEERWGDSLFFGGQKGAAAHFHAALRALVPQSVQFTSLDESTRRMEAHARVMNKIYAIDGAGLARTSHDGRPHPNTRLAPPPEPAATLPDRADADGITIRPARKRQEKAILQLFGDGGHWQDHDLGQMWRNAGEALTPAFPEAARRAYAWSLLFFDLYSKAWSANLPASRWDSDGSQEMAEVQESIDALGPLNADVDCPVWIDSLVDGAWRKALAALAGERPPLELQPLAVLLARICRAAGDEESARFLTPKPAAGSQ
ncbi:hypothetical protein [uncultured Paludibaculum sp.]|uniref:hypothetical protein n=1 Tax=uncultured Paludibaculum sp. TaxID=1765020 RepID=UPI002AAC3A19|nr:hypothetical protein [uncultured Paludibaculum sp.]